MSARCAACTWCNEEARATAASATVCHVRQQATSSSSNFRATTASSFVVAARITPQSRTRCAFSFTSAALRRPAPAAPLSLPPVGAGWFDNVYVDRELRVARDSRGDTLVVERAAPWRG